MGQAERRGSQLSNGGFRLKIFDRDTTIFVTRLKDKSISSPYNYIVACQRGGVSRKPPDLRAETRLTLL